MALKRINAIAIGASTFVLTSMMLTGLVQTAAAAPGNPCASGETWLQPTTVENLPDGGHLDDYWINGALNQVPVPPPGFKPSVASTELLARYGFPERPSDVGAFKLWNEEMSVWHPTQDLGLCETNMKATILTSPVWAGFDAGWSSNLFIAVQGDFKQPTRGSTSCSNAQEVSWVGLGGTSSTLPLIQAGSGMDAGGGYYAWYEYLKPGGGINLTKMPSVTVHPGDSMHSYVVHQTSGLGQTTFYVQDGTTGTSQSVIVNLDSTYYDGTTAEWIDERPTASGGSPLPLANFGTVNWTNVQAQKSTGTWYNLGSLLYNEIDMYAGGVYLAYPQPPSGSNTFTDNWYRCS